MSAAGDLLLDRVRDAYARTSRDGDTARLLRVEMAAFGPEAGMIGAADLARDVAGRGGGTASG